MDRYSGRISLPLDVAIPNSATRFKFNTVQHVTHWPATACQILTGASPGAYVFDSPEPHPSLGFKVSWWGIVPNVEEVIVAPVMPALADEGIPRESEMGVAYDQEFKQCYELSPAFQKSSRYGPYVFQANFRGLLATYRELVNDEVVFLTLGTYHIGFEYAHAIMVAPKSVANGLMATYPSYSDSGAGGEIKIWDPENDVWTTSSVFNSRAQKDSFRGAFQGWHKTFCEWEQLEFAFWVPDSGFLVPPTHCEFSLTKHVTPCIECVKSKRKQEKMTCNGSSEAESQHNFSFCITNEVVMRYCEKAQSCPLNSSLVLAYFDVSIATDIISYNTNKCGFLPFATIDAMWKRAGVTTNRLSEEVINAEIDKLRQFANSL